LSRQVRKSAVGARTKETRFRYYEKGPLLGKLREKLELGSVLEVGKSGRGPTRARKKRKSWHAGDGL